MAAAPETIYDAVGEVGIACLVQAFYAQVPTDEILGPMYVPAELPESERRLRDFLIYRFGGPDRYIVERGNPRLRIRHAPFVVDQIARNRWVQLMLHAIQSADFTPEISGALEAFFKETATFLINH
ncbi:MAG: globin [Planctomycetaceae bacterium]|nr:globin [Planctomycetaceae bacterium]